MTPESFNEPWHVATNPGGPGDQPAFPSVRDATGLKHGQDIVAMPCGNSETVCALAARIVAAVNFCAGIPTDELVGRNELSKAMNQPATPTPRTTSAMQGMIDGSGLPAPALVQATKGLCDEAQRLERELIAMTADRDRALAMLKVAEQRLALAKESLQFLLDPAFDAGDASARDIARVALAAIAQIKEGK